MQEAKLKRREKPVAKASYGTWWSHEEPLSVSGRGGTCQVWLPGGEQVEGRNDGEGDTRKTIALVLERNMGV